MSIDSRIQTMLYGIEDTIAPNVYDGAETEYLVYNYYSAGAIYAESRPRALVYSVMVHLYLPHGENPTAKKNSISEAIHAAGGTWPSVTNASDGKGQHYVFEFEMHAGNEPPPPESEPAQSESENNGEP